MDERDARVESLVKAIVRATIELEKEGIKRVQITLPDYIEWKVRKILNHSHDLGLTLVDTVNREGYDAKDNRGKRYQIKYRTGDQYSSTAFENVRLNKFDYLLCVFTKKDFEIQAIYKVPHDTVLKYKKDKSKRMTFRWNKKTRNIENVEKVYPT